MRRLLLCLLSCLLLTAIRGLCNTAQPGIFQAGGTANFVLLYPEDSNSFRKIQMVDEHITIQLYHGYGVVKGEYKMYNTSRETVTIKVGYPVNSSLRANEQTAEAARIFFDKLYALKSFTNGKENTLIIKPGPAKMSQDENNWYVWENTFKPLDTTTITVYFIVNTNNTIIRQGYTTDENNGFIYLLETGATWKQPIVNGTIKIGLMDNITISDIRGLSPASKFRIDKQDNQLLYRFNNLSPAFNDNIILIYTPDLKQFDFGSIAQKTPLLFGAVDSFSKQTIDETKLTVCAFADPYKVHSVNSLGIVIVSVIVVVCVIVFIVAFWIIRSLIRFFRRHRPSDKTKV